MADKGIITISTITDIADAIREKTGDTGVIPTTEMAAKIRSISTSGSTETIAGVTVDGTTLKVDTDSYERIEVGQGGDDETGTVVISGLQIPVELNEDEDSSVIVENLQPTNIKKDVTILGVTGTMEEATSSFDITKYTAVSATSTTYTDGTNSAGTAIRTFTFEIPVTPTGSPSSTPPTIELLGIDFYISLVNNWKTEYSWRTTSGYHPLLQQTMYYHYITFTMDTTITTLTSMTVVAIYKTV